jgi:hypothetical protein
MARDEQSEEEDNAVAAVVKATKPKPKVPATPYVTTAFRRTPQITSSTHRTPSTPKKAGKATTQKPALGSPFTPKNKGRTFGDLLGGSSPQGKVTRTLGNAHTRRVTQLPDVCEANDEQLQDPQLREYYQALPNLKCVVHSPFLNSTLKTIKKAGILFVLE